MKEDKPQEQKFMIDVSGSESEIEKYFKINKEDISYDPMASGNESERSEKSEFSIGNKVEVSDNKAKAKSKLVFSKFNLKPSKNKNLMKRKEIAAASYTAKIPSQDQVQTLLEDITNLKKQIFNLRKENLNLKEESSYITLENAKMKRIKDNEIASQNEKLDSLERLKNKLSIQVEEMKKDIQEYKPKAEHYDQMKRDYNKISEEKDLLDKKNQDLVEERTRILDDKSKIQSDYSLLKIENDNLRQDNIHLTTNKSILEDTVKQQLNTIKNLEDDIRQKDRDNLKYIDKLTEKNLSLDKLYEQNFSEKIKAIEEKYEKDRKIIIDQYTKINEEQVAALKDDRQEARTKIKILQDDVKAKEDMIDTLQKDLLKNQNTSTEQITLLRVQLNIKTEELNTRMNLYDEQVAALTICKNEIDSLKEKNDLLRHQIIKSEGDYKANIAEYKAKIANLQAKIETYDNIEDELDKAISSGVADQDNPETNEILQVLRDVPTTSKRRISQCLSLANKLKVMTVENTQLKNYNETLNTEIKGLRDEINIYKSVGDKVNQPTSYLIKNLQDNELEMFQLKSELDKKEQIINRLKNENQILSEKISAMSLDMKTIVGNRNKLDNLENMITSYIQNGNTFEGASTSWMQNSNNNPNFNNTNINNGSVIMNQGISQTNPMFNNKSLSMTNMPNDNGMSGNLMNSNSNNMNVFSTQMNSTERVPNWYTQLKSKKLFS